MDLPDENEFEEQDGEMEFNFASLNLPKGVENAPLPVLEGIFLGADWQTASRLCRSFARFRQLCAGGIWNERQIKEFGEIGPKTYRSDFRNYLRSYVANQYAKASTFSAHPLEPEKFYYARLNQEIVKPANEASMVLARYLKLNAANSFRTEVVHLQKYAIPDEQHYLKLLNEVQPQPNDLWIFVQPIIQGHSPGYIAIFYYGQDAKGAPVYSVHAGYIYNQGSLDFITFGTTFVRNFLRVYGLTIAAVDFLYEPIINGQRHHIGVNSRDWF